MKDAILADNANFMKAEFSDLAAGNAHDSLLLNYATTTGAAPWQQGIADHHAKGLTITGTERIYHRVIDKIDTTKNPPTASMYVCDDQTKAFDKEIATGKVRTTPVTDSDYLLYFFGLQKSASGVWQVYTSGTHQNDQAVKEECR